jgi:hypothetical protein
MYPWLRVRAVVAPLSASDTCFPPSTLFLPTHTPPARATGYLSVACFMLTRRKTCACACAYTNIHHVHKLMHIRRNDGCGEPSPVAAPCRTRPSFKSPPCPVLQAIDQEKLSLRQSLLTSNAASAAAQSRLEEEIAARSELQHRVDELTASCLSLEDRLGRASGVQSSLTSAMTMGACALAHPAPLGKNRQARPFWGGKKTHRPPPLHTHTHR